MSEMENIQEQEVLDAAEETADKVQEAADMEETNDASEPESISGEAIEAAPLAGCRWCRRYWFVSPNQVLPA